MTDNKTYYKLSNTTLTQSEIQNITFDIQTINRDWSDPNVSTTTIMNEMAKYYTDQGYSRSYATQASYVVLNQNDPNGNVANANIGSYYSSIGIPFTERVRLTVSYNLINKDYSLLTQQNYIIPNENEITDEHVKVFDSLGIPITYWGGSIFAQYGVDFVSGLKNAAEIINSEYMSDYMPVNNSGVSDLGNLLLAFVKNYEHYPKYFSYHARSEILTDASNLIKVLSLAGLEGGIHAIASTEDIDDGTLNIKNTNGDELLSISSNNNINYNIGDLSNTNIGSIQTISNNQDITLNYQNGTLSSILNINTEGEKWLTSLIGNNIYINGQLVSATSVADAFNHNNLLNILKSLEEASSKSVDPILVTLNKDFNIKQLSTLDSYQSIDNSSTKYLMQSLGKDTYYLVSVGNNDKPIFYNQENIFSLDTNNDNIINSSDSIYSNLFLWNPNDGSFTMSNCISLSDAGINEITLNKNIINLSNQGAIQTAQYATNNSDIFLGSFNLSYSPTNTVTQADQEIASGQLSKTITQTNADGTTQTIDLSTLPNWHGYGVLSSLTASMITIGSNANTLNSALYNDVLGLTKLDLNNTSYATVIENFDTLLKDWSDTANLYEGDTGIILPDKPMYNNYHLQVLDKYLGQATFFTGHNTYEFYGTPSKVSLDIAYNDLERTLVGEFFLQSQYKDLQTYIQYDSSNDILSNSSSFATILQYVNTNYASEMSDKSSTFYNVFSDLIYGTMTSQNEQYSDVYFDMSQTNAEQASEFLMSVQSISISNNIDGSLSVVGNDENASSYIWSGTLNENISTIGHNDFFSSIGVSEKVNNKLIIDANSTDINLFLLGNVLQLSSNNTNTLNISNTVVDTLDEIDFKDQQVTLNNNELVFNSNAIVTGDTSSLVNNMYVYNNATVSYDFSQDVTLYAGSDYTINMSTSDLLNYGNFKSQGNSYTITYAGHTLTLMDSTSSKITVMDNGKSIAYGFGSQLFNNANFNRASTVSQTISTPGTYIYDASAYTDNISITNPGEYSIYLTGYNSGLRENLTIPTGADNSFSVYQTNATDLQVVSANTTVNLKNAYAGINQSNNPAIVFSDLGNINNKDLINTSFKVEQSGGVAVTGYAGRFEDNLNNDTNDIEIRTGTFNTLYDLDGHSLYIESLNGKLSSGQTNIVVSSTINPNTNYYPQLESIANSATYVNGNIVWTNSYTNQTYTIMNADSFSSPQYNISLTFKTTDPNKSTTYNLSLRNTTINYNINDSNFTANKLSYYNNVNLLADYTNVSYSGNSTYNTYNISKHGTYIVSGTSDKFNINVDANIEIKSGNRATLSLNNQLSDYSYSRDNLNNLLIEHNGYTIKIDGYNNFNGLIKGYSGTTLSSYENLNLNGNSTITADVYANTGVIYQYGTNVSQTYNDNYASTQIANYTTGSSSIYNLNNTTYIYSNTGTNNNMTFNLLSNNYLKLSTSGVFANVALNGSQLTFTYSSPYSSTPNNNSYTINNAIDYFSTQNGGQDTLKLTYTDTSSQSEFTNIFASLSRTIVKATSDTVVSTANNKIFVNANNLNISDQSSNNEYSIDSSLRANDFLALSSNDKVLLANESSINTSFSLSGDKLVINNLLRDTNLTISNVVNSNNSILFSDGKSISVDNAFKYAQDLQSMHVTLGTIMPDMLSKDDYSKLAGLFNN